MYTELYLYVLSYRCTYICIYVCVCVFISAYICIDRYICTYMCIYICAYVHIFIDTFMIDNYGCIATTLFTCIRNCYIIIRGTLNNNNTFKTFSKNNHPPTYMNVNSNQPRSIINQIPIAVNSRINRLLSNKKIFEEIRERLMKPWKIVYSSIN